MDNLEERFQEAIEKTLEDTINEQEEGVSLEDYPDIPLEQLPDGVVDALREWEQNAEDKESRPLLWWLLGGEEGGVGTPPYKMSKDLANYTDQAQNPGTSCATCEYLYQKTTTGEHICSQISGKVEPEGWCKLWKEANVYNES